MEKCDVFDRVGSCKENVRRNIIYLIELRAVRSLLVEWLRYPIELGVVRRMLRRNARYLIELRAVRSVLEEFRGID